MIYDSIKATLVLPINFKVTITATYISIENFKSLSRGLYIVFCTFIISVMKCILVFSKKINIADSIIINFNGTTMVATYVAMPNI